MTAIDWILGPCLFCGFGLWLAIFPGSVIRFYTWFHKGRVQMPKPVVIRVLGLAWLLLMASVAVFGRKKGVS